MPKMGNYCKAYLLSRLRHYPGWQEAPEALAAGQGTEATLDEKSDPIVYLQEDYRVTNGIFLDDPAVFDQVTPEWQQYCVHELEFLIPPVEEAAVAAEPAGL
jgi:hypothetical protein